MGGLSVGGVNQISLFIDVVCGINQFVFASKYVTIFCEERIKTRLNML